LWAWGEPKSLQKQGDFTIENGDFPIENGNLRKNISFEQWILGFDP